MMNKIKINLIDLLLCISSAEDLVSPDFPDHHKRVAYLAFRLAQYMRLPVEQQKEVFLASLIHDIGALSMRERLQIIESEPDNINVHAYRGARLIQGFEPLQKVAGIIKFHHIGWDGGRGRYANGEEVPLASHIIHLADRICVRIDSSRNVLVQVPEVMKYVQEERNGIFMPDLADAALDISNMECLWLDLVNRSTIETVANFGLFDIIELEIDDIIDYAHLISHLIDFRSRFTARHSAGVAKTAEKLAQLFYFSPYECKMMLIAGYLHDLGKLAIDNEVLEKPRRLSEEEFNDMRMHTYYTYYLLDSIPQFNVIKKWAAYHHEKINGDGYPFHIKGDNLSLGSRIMAVADVFNAITEDRPYRLGMKSEDAFKTLNKMVESGALDGNVVNVLMNNYESISELRRNAQEKASADYEVFSRE